MDGGENYAVTICGSTFTSNVSGPGGLGGAIFRTPDGDMQTTTIDRSSFSENSADQGGALYFHNSQSGRDRLDFREQHGEIRRRALFSDSSTLNFTNDTFANNVSKSGLGGSYFLIRYRRDPSKHRTFLGNQANGGSGYFGAAIAGNTTLTITNTLCFTAITQLKIADLPWPASPEAARALGTCSGQPNTSYARPGTGFVRMVPFSGIPSLAPLPTMAVRP